MQKNVDFVPVAFHDPKSLLFRSVNCTASKSTTNVVFSETPHGRTMQIFDLYVVAVITINKEQGTSLTVELSITNDKQANLTV